MKTKQKIIFVPFEAVPICTPLRFKGEWWRRKSGTSNCLCGRDKKFSLISEKDVVAMFKKHLDSKKHYLIIDEI